MNAERLIREALENSVKDLPCPEPDIEQLLASGRAGRRHRVLVVASLAAAAVLVLVLAGLSFAWAGGTGRALEPVPANPTPSETFRAALTSDVQRWIDALPAGAPPSTPYWHDGTLYVDGVQIPAPYEDVEIQVAGDSVLVGGATTEPRTGGVSTQWALVRGDGLEPLPVPAGAQVGLSVDGRIAYWVTHVPGTKQFFTWDTETSTALASRTVSGRQVELWGIDASGNGYWQADATEPLPSYTRWDVRADADTATDLTFGMWNPPETFFDVLPPWMHSAEAYRSPDGTRMVFANSAVSPSDCCPDQLRVRLVGPDAVDPQDVKTLAVSQDFPEMDFDVGNRNGYWTWWESNDAVLLSVDGDLQTYLVRCPANGGACERVVDFGTLSYPTDADDAEWSGDWGFARAPVQD